jgi:hypothetical protein
MSRLTSPAGIRRDASAAGSAGLALLPRATAAAAPDPPSLPPSGFWVCAFGLDGTVQERVLARFASCGRILRTVPSGANAVALLYENPLHASKALCLAPFQVDGRYCGAFPVPNNDLAAFLKQPAAWPAPSSSSWSPMLENAPPLLHPPARHPTESGSPFLFAPSKPAPAAPTATAALAPSSAANEEDGDGVFLRHRRRDSPAAAASGSSAADREGLCLRIVRWFLSVE